jgi:hypothetical protein
MVGDSLREMAVLILVFYSLDSAFNQKLTFWGFVLVLIGCGALLWCGIILEGKDEL